MTQTLGWNSSHKSQQNVIFSLRLKRKNNMSNKKLKKLTNLLRPAPPNQTKIKKPN